MKGPIFNWKIHNTYKIFGVFIIMENINTKKRITNHVIEKLYRYSSLK